MSSHTNGSGQTPEDPDSKDEKSKILRFPTLAERDRLRREKEEQEKAWQQEYRQQKSATSQPFFKAGNIPPFARALFLTLLAVQVCSSLLLDDSQRLQLYYTFGFVPGYYTGAIQPFPLTALLAPLTHLLIHGGWMHLIFNSIMGVALTVYFEKSFGTRSAAIFFVLCGLLGAAFYFVLNPFSTTPVVGASGSISGLFGAMIILMHNTPGLRPLGRRGPWPLIAFWVVFMSVTGLFGGSNMAWQAHVGGFIAGIALTHYKLKGRLHF
jgi:membrane associated rhomboid family serine protease